MRRIFILIAAFCLLCALSVNVSAQCSMGGTAMQKSLYERLGGKDAIAAVTDEFISRVAADTRINAKFAKSDVPRVRLHLIEQLCLVTGGPCVYTGQSMKKTHKNMKVTEGEFGALAEDLVATLDKFHVPAKEKNELIALLAPLKGQIVEVNSSATGTPLPPNFKPAPPLPKSQIDAGPKMKPAPKSKAGMKKATM